MDFTKISSRHGKVAEFGKISSCHGKVMEIGKLAKVVEKSWNLEKLAKIMEKSWNLEKFAKVMEKSWTLQKFDPPPTPKKCLGRQILHNILIVKGKVNTKINLRLCEIILHFGFQKCLVQSDSSIRVPENIFQKSKSTAERETPYVHPQSKTF